MVSTRPWRSHLALPPPRRTTHLSTTPLSKAPIGPSLPIALTALPPVSAVTTRVRDQAALPLTSRRDRPSRISLQVSPRRIIRALARKTFPHHSPRRPPRARFHNISACTRRELGNLPYPNLRYSISSS